jgi:hypothetical protein
MCTYCAPGRYSDPVSTQSRCDPCPMTKYQIAYGGSSCSDCSGFRTTNTTGSSSASACTGCVAGARKSAGTSCTLCAYGTYSSFDANQCIPYPQGRYGSNLEYNSLLDCSKCPTGTYNPETGSSSSESCRQCAIASSVHCPEGSAAIVVDPGFWTDGNMTVDCVPSQACKGGNVSNSNAINLCSQGYTGYTCSECQNEFFRLSGLCKKCIAKGVRWFLMCFSAIILVILVRVSIKKGFQVAQNVKLSLFWFPCLFKEGHQSCKTYSISSLLQIWILDTLELVVT